MKHSDDLVIRTPPPSEMGIVAEMGSYALDDLEDAIHIRRVAIMANRLGAAGFSARTEGPMRSDGTADQFRYLCVYPPEGEGKGEWGTLEECDRLMDTVRSIPPTEAFQRWCVKVAPMETSPYTRSDAVRDMKAERAQLKQDYDEGKIDGGMYHDLHAASRDFLGYAK